MKIPVLMLMIQSKYEVVEILFAEAATPLHLSKNCLENYPVITEIKGSIKRTSYVNFCCPRNLRSIFSKNRFGLKKVHCLKLWKFLWKLVEFS